MPKNLTSEQILLMIYSKEVIRALILSLIIKKLTKWNLLKSVVITVISAFISYFMMAPLCVAGLLLSRLDVGMLLIAFSYVKSVLIRPLMFIAVLRTINQLYVNKSEEYSFEIKTYLILVLFALGMKALKDAMLFFSFYFPLPPTIKYFLLLF